MGLRDVDHRLALALLLVLLASYRFVRCLSAPRITRDGRPLRNPPGTLPLVGNGLLFMQERQKLFAWFSRCQRLYGRETLCISVPSLPPGVIISDPRNLEFVFRHEGVFGKGDFFTSRSADVFGRGIINVDGDLWRRQRRAGLHFLSAQNLAVLTDVLLPRYLGRVSERLMESAKKVVAPPEASHDTAAPGERDPNAGVVDLQQVFHEITTQIMGQMAYGMEMHAGDAFTLAFEHASGATAERFQNPLWFLTELFTGGRMRRSLAIIKNHGRRIVRSAVANTKASKPGEGGVADNDREEEDGLEKTSGSLIQSLLEALGDHDLVADAALNYLSAGRDTVAQALTWTFYLLLKNPDVLSNLRGSIITSRPPEADNSWNTTLTPENLAPSKMPYAMAVFYESLRLYPPIPFEIKQALQDTTLPDGTFLPASSVVVWCPWAMNRSFETWGADADTFRPERWLVDEQSSAGTAATARKGGGDRSGKSLPPAVVHRSAAEFPVFNGGQRLCLGKRMAELIAVQVVATLAMRFDFVPAFEGERVSRSSLTLPMQDGLPVRVRLGEVGERVQQETEK